MSSVPPIQADLDAIPVASFDGKYGKDVGAVDNSKAKHPASASSDQSGPEDDHYFGKNPFSDPAVAAHWRDVYEKSRYECRHVFDPEMTWTEEEEKKLVRKIDWRVCLWAVSGHGINVCSLQFI